MIETILSAWVQGPAVSLLYSFVSCPSCLVNCTLTSGVGVFWCRLWILLLCPLLPSKRVLWFCGFSESSASHSPFSHLGQVKQSSAGPQSSWWWLSIHVALYSPDWPFWLPESCCQALVSPISSSCFASWSPVLVELYGPWFALCFFSLIFYFSLIYPLVNSDNL